MVMQRGGCDGDEAPGRCTLEAKGRLMQQAAGHVSGTSTEVVVVCRCFLERYADEPSSSSCNAQSDWQASSATIHVPSLTNNIRRQLTWPRWRLIIRLVRTTTCKAGTHDHLQGWYAQPLTSLRLHRGHVHRAESKHEHLRRDFRSGMEPHPGTDRSDAVGMLPGSCREELQVAVHSPIPRLTSKVTSILAHSDSD